MLTFFFLQFLDFATTLIGLRIGASEASPLVRFLLTAGIGPVLSVMGSKLVAFALAGVCIGLQRRHVIRWINYWYAALAAWNVFIIIRLAS
jgi:hypothetical protein